MSEQTQGIIAFAPVRSRDELPPPDQNYAAVDLAQTRDGHVFMWLVSDGRWVNVEVCGTADPQDKIRIATLEAELLAARDFWPVCEEI